MDDCDDAAERPHEAPEPPRRGRKRKPDEARSTSPAPYAEDFGLWVEQETSGDDRPDD